MRNILVFGVFGISATIMVAAQTQGALKALNLATVEQRAEAGDPAAENELADRIMAMGAPPVQAPKAIGWYRKAADQGNAAAESSLAWLYYSGRGTPRDFSQAFLWYAKAANQGEPSAEYWVSKFYQQGMGGAPQDADKASYWLHKSANDGSPQAISALSPGAPIPFRPEAAQTAPPTNRFAQPNTAQGTCAVVYEAQTAHTDAYGTYSTYGGAWGRATLKDAQDAARADVYRSLGGTPLGAPLIGADSSGMLADASGCGHAHGAIAVMLKTVSNDGQWHTFADNVFSMIDAVLADTTDAAASQAVADCKARFQGAYQDVYNCHVVVQW